MRHPVARLLAVAFAVLALSASAASALAADYPKLTGQVTDLAGKVDVNDPAILGAISTLRQDQNINLRVLLADSMGGVNPGDYARNEAQANDLGSHDALLVVTFGDRQYAIWVGPGITTVTAGEIDSILAGDVAPQLKSGEIAAALVAGINGLEQAAGSAEPLVTPDPAYTPGPPADYSGLFNGIVTIIFWLAIIGGTGLLIFALAAVAWAWWRARSSDMRLVASIQSLSRQAASALVSTDEALKAAAQEVDFVEAEFGADSAAPHRKTLEPLNKRMSGVFALAAKLNDPDFSAAHEPTGQDTGIVERMTARWRDPSLPARNAGYQQILDETAAINAALTAESDEVRKLRDLENTLPARLPALSARLAAARQAISAAEPVLAALKARSASASGAVATNLKGARDLADLAGKDLATASATTTPKGQATLAAGRAEGRLAKIDTLLAGVATMSAQVDAAAKSLPDHLAAAKAEIERAAKADTANDVKGEEKEIKAARDKLDAAKRQAGEDPYAADALAQAALAAASAVIGEVRDAQEARKRKEAAARDALAAAQRSLTEAQTYIESHRSVVSAGARTRLEKARAQLDPYQRSGMDPLQLYLAMSVLQSVQHDAASAYSRAQSDVSSHEASVSSGSSWSSSHDTYSGGSWGGGGISSGGSFGGGFGGTSSGGGW